MNEVTVVEQKAVAVFSQFEKELQEWKEQNKSVVFDIETAKGNKEARSFVANIRKSKKPISEAHKNAKAESRDYGLKLDAEKNRILSEIDEVIEIHAAPLAALEQAEALRVDTIKARIISIESFARSHSDDGVEYDSRHLHGALSALKSIIIDDSFEEFKGLAAQAKDAALTALESLVTDAEQKEKEAAELESLRAEKVIRDAEIRDEEIRDAARLKAEKVADDELDAERKAGERRELELKLKAESAEREKLEAANQAEIDKQKAIDDERHQAELARIKVEDDALCLKQAEEKKAANKAHQRKINIESKACFEKEGVANSEEIIILIAKGLIKNVTINY